MKIERVENIHDDFIGLTNELDAELNDRCGSQQNQYDKHNIIDPLDTAIIGYVDQKPVACGCFKVIDSKTVDIKRMYVAGPYRRKGLSVIILKALEKWSFELGYTQVILETGKKQVEAIGLYKKSGYVIIDNHGPYKDFDNSICMKKLLQ